MAPAERDDPRGVAVTRDLLRKEAARPPRLRARARRRRSRRSARIRRPSRRDAPRVRRVRRPCVAASAHATVREAVAHVDEVARGPTTSERLHGSPQTEHAVRRAKEDAAIRPGADRAGSRAPRARGPRARGRARSARRKPLGDDERPVPCGRTPRTRRAAERSRARTRRPPRSGARTDRNSPAMTSLQREIAHRAATREPRRSRRRRTRAARGGARRSRWPSRPSRARSRIRAQPCEPAARRTPIPTTSNSTSAAWRDVLRRARAPGAGDDDRPDRDFVPVRRERHGGRPVEAGRRLPRCSLGRRRRGPRLRSTRPVPRALPGSPRRGRARARSRDPSADVAAGSRHSAKIVNRGWMHPPCRSPRRAAGRASGCFVRSRSSRCYRESRPGSRTHSRPGRR